MGFGLVMKELDKHNYRDILCKAIAIRLYKTFSSCGWLDELLQLSSKNGDENDEGPDKKSAAHGRRGSVYQDSRGSNDLASMIDDLSLKE